MEHIGEEEKRQMDVPWRLIRSLAGKKARQETGLTLVEGPGAVCEGFEAGVEIETLVISDSFGDSPESRKLMQALETYPWLGQVYHVPDQLFSRMSATYTPQGILCVVKVPFRFRRGLPESPWKTSLNVMGVDIQDPGNVGTLIRSAASAGAHEIVFAGESADPFSPKAIRASAGAVFRVMVGRESDPSAQASKWFQSGIRLYSTWPRKGKYPWEVSFTDPCAIVFGNEAKGLQPGILGSTGQDIVVPMPGGTESLNVAVAAAMVLYEVIRQRTVDPQN